MASEREQTEEQAAHWISREDRGLTSEEVTLRDAWLDGATAHRMAYLRLKSGWQRTERLAALRPVSLLDADEPWLVRHRALAAAAAILVVLAAGSGLYLHTRSVPQQTYVARGDARPILHLADGTRIQLNADTQVRTDVREATSHRHAGAWRGLFRCRA